MGKHLFVTFLLFIILPGFAFGQRKIGIQWTVPTQSQKAQTELNQFSSLGISYLLIDHNPAPQVWEIIKATDFKIFAQLPISFPVRQTWNHLPKKELNASLKSYSEEPAVQAIGIFAYANDNNNRFRSAAATFIDSVKSVISKPIFYITVRNDSSKMDALFDFKIISTPQLQGNPRDDVGGYLYRPERDARWDLKPVKNLLEATQTTPQTPVFFPDKWLRQMLQKHPDLRETLSLYAHTSESTFPLPKPSASHSYNNSIIAFMLLLLWIIFAFTYNFNPLYRHSFVRYFTGHQFFIDDVMKRHIRSLFTGFSILIQHCISGGIVFYCLCSALFTYLGFQALYTHYPMLVLFGTSHLAYFGWGFTITLIAELLAVIWLWLANPKHTTPAQIFNLFPWLLQLNLLNATLIAAFYFSGGSQAVIYILGLFFVILFNSGFLITCFDTARYGSVNRHRYLAGTIGLYLIGIVGLIVWISLLPELQHVIGLAISLP